MPPVIPTYFAWSLGADFWNWTKLKDCCRNCSAVNMFLNAFLTVFAYLLKSEWGTYRPFSLGQGIWGIKQAHEFLFCSWLTVGTRWTMFWFSWTTISMRIQAFWPWEFSDMNPSIASSCWNVHVKCQLITKRTWYTKLYISLQGVFCREFKKKMFIWFP